jgi:hypothetical protein
MGESVFEAIVINYELLLPPLRPRTMAVKVSAKISSQVKAPHRINKPGALAKSTPLTSRVFVML